MMEIKVLGPGCANCHAMEELAKKAVQELGVERKSKNPEIKVINIINAGV
jgi:hypothetical protein